MLGVFDKDSRLAKVIGKIVNIDEKKKELQRLKIMAMWILPPEFTTNRQRKI